MHTKVCFKSGATLETAGTGVIVQNGPPVRVLTANHVVDQRQWEAVDSVEITVRRRGSTLSGYQPAKVTHMDGDADIAELEVDLDDGVVWQPATVPGGIEAPKQGDTLSFLCFFEQEIRRGAVGETVTRAGDSPTYEINAGAPLGCSGAGAITPDGRLAGIVIQSNNDVTRVSGAASLQ